MTADITMARALKMPPSWFLRLGWQRGRRTDSGWVRGGRLRIGAGVLLWGAGRHIVMEERLNLRDHWNRVYQTKGVDEVSWYQAEPRVSLGLIRELAPAPSSRIIDVGGGASFLVDRLIEAGYRDLSVLDLSGRALSIVRTRLGAQAELVEWLEGDVLDVGLPGDYHVWHDRAVFHFLPRPEDRRRYVEQVRRSVRPAGHVVVATFSEGGPMKCSGLDVMRYDPEALRREFGEGFELVKSQSEAHRTPTGSAQSFVYCVFRTVANAPRSGTEEQNRPTTE